LLNFAAFNLFSAALMWHSVHFSTPVQQLQQW